MWEALSQRRPGIRDMVARRRRPPTFGGAVLTRIRCRIDETSMAPAIPGGSQGESVGALIGAAAVAWYRCTHW